MENNKKALWVSEDMHHELSVFAAINKIDIGKATELLVKLGLIEHKNTKWLIAELKDITSRD